MVDIEKTCAQYGVDVFVAVATSATREAANRQDMVRAIAEKTGIEVEIISGAEESRLVALGNLGERPMAKQDYLIIDIGGGSAEVIFTNDYSIIEAQSLPLGAVRLKENYIKSDPIKSREYDILHDQITATIKSKLKIRALPQNTVCFGSAGTIRTLIEMNTDQKWKNTENKTLSLARIKSLITQMKDTRLNQRIKMFNLEPQRADIILPGALVLMEIMQNLSIPEVRLSPFGVRDGLLQDFMETHGFKPEPVFDRERAYMKSLYETVARYGSEKEHMVHVCNLALSIFDALQPLHNLGAMEKNILKGAAMLHDIGQYISYSKHHKHSYYLITHSDIAGITEREKLLIATVARYHRRALPSLKQPEFLQLIPEDRVIVKKLGAILRIADALDKEHQSLVSSVDCITKKGKIEFHLHASRHIPVELWAAARKGELFEKTYQLKPVFIEA